jgi:hypothetical protein
VHAGVLLDGAASMQTRCAGIVKFFSQSDVANILLGVGRGRVQKQPESSRYCRGLPPISCCAGSRDNQDMAELTKTTLYWACQWGKFLQGSGPGEAVLGLLRLGLTSRDIPGVHPHSKLGNGSFGLLTLK